MANRPVVLGWPISLALRGISGLTSTIGTTATAAVGIAGAVTAAAPWLASTISAPASETTPTSDTPTTTSSTNDILSLTDLLGGLFTFLDMNAEIVTVTEKRRMAVVSVPGRESDYLQDLGAHTVRYNVRGRFFDTDPQYLTHRGIMQTLLKTVIGSAAVGSTQMLRLLMRTASPVPFISEHEVSFAVITDFSFTQVGGEPHWVNYNMVLMEYGRIPYIAKMALLGASNLVS